MTAALHPFGAVLAYSSNDSSYTNLTGVRSVKMPDISVGETDGTDLASANAFKESVPSWGDGGNVTFSVYMTKAQIAALYALVRLVYYWRLTFPLVGAETTGSSWKAQGFITKIEGGELSADSDDACMVNFTVAVTGKPTFTQGS